MRILFEDNHLLVVIKPVGMVVHADETGDPDLVTELKELRRVKENKPGNIYVGLIHRLDRMVGGVMVFAKTSKAASRLSEQNRNRTMEKTYLAVARGTGMYDGYLEDYLLKDEKTNTSKVVDSGVVGAKRARLLFRVLDERDDLSLMHIKLETGRSHQIRVQFASKKHPLVGDVRYGKETGNTEGPALWSYSVMINHPVTKEQMIFDALPDKAYPWDIFDLRDGELELPF